MLRLVTFNALLVLALAQNGYDYSRPGQLFGAGKPFSAASTPGQTRPGTATTSSGYPAPTSPTFTSQGPEEYPTTGISSTPGLTAGPQGYPSGPNQANFPTGQNQANYPTGSNQGGYSPGANQGSFPSGQNQNFPGGNNQNPQQGFQEQSPGGVTSGFQGQDSNGPQSFPTGGQNYPGQTGTDSNGPSGGGFGSTSSGFSPDTGAYEGGDYSAIPGEPDRDYPIYSEIPQTSFRCDAQAYPGYYADVEARCQVFHICANNRTYDFLCPNGTVFSQEVFVCVWWNQFDCNSAPDFYALNANLYSYPVNGGQNAQDSGFQQGQSSFPSDTTGPSFPGAIGVQAPSYTGDAGAQGPTSSFPGATGNTPAGFTGSTGPQGFPTSPGPSGYPSDNSQRPTTNFPGSQPSTSFAGTGTGQNGYPDSGTQPTAFPGSQGTGFPSSQTTGFGSRPSGQGSQGYPSGRPSGPGFASGRPGQGQNGPNYPNPPNREYLPPKN